MKNNRIYIINPNYRMLSDVDRVVLTGLGVPVPEYRISYDESHFSLIHPLQAQILSFFDGEKPLLTVIDELIAYFGLEKEYIASLVGRLLENPDPVGLTSRGLQIPFPRNMLIRRGGIEKFRVYRKDDFSLYEEADLTDMRLKIPKTMLLVLNTECRTDCVYCYADRSHKVTAPLSTERILEIIDEMYSLEALSIQLNGGEVLLKPGIMRIIARLAEIGLPPLISTKLPLSEKRVRELKEAGVGKMQVSLDSSDDAHLSEILKVGKGYYGRMLRTITLLDKYGIDTVIQSIITSTNCSLPELERLIEDTMDFDCVREMIIVNAGYSLNRTEKENRDFFVPADKVTRIRDMVAEIKERYPGKTINFRKSGMSSRESENPELKKELVAKRTFCPGNQMGLTVMPDGKVTICENLYWDPRFILGDLTTQSVMEVWNSEKAKWFHRLPQAALSEKSACRSCGTYMKCRGRYNRVCWLDVVTFYGPENWDFPDPKCPQSPPPLRDCLLI